MLQKIKSHIRSPWMWFTVLIVLGVGLSAGLSQADRGTSLRIADTPSTINANNSCIPMMERTNGVLTGRVTCVTDLQLVEFCTEVLKERKEANK